MSHNETIDDSSPDIRYEPSSAWESNGSLGVYGPYNGTIRSTAQEGASATFTFRGTSVSLSCLLVPTGANLTATLDSESLGTFDTSVSSYSAAAVKVIFTKDGLDGSADHVLVITKAANDPHWQSTITGDPFSHVNIDSFTIIGNSVSGGGSPSSNPSSSPSSSKPPIGAIVGGVVGGIVLLLLVGILLWRRRRSRPHGLVHVTPTEAPINQDGSLGRVLDVGSDRREKVILPGMESSVQEPTGGRWRSSLLQLPGHRILRADSRYEEDRESMPLERIPTASASSIRNASPPRLLPTTHQGTVLSLGTVDTSAQPSSSTDRGDTHSSVPPSTVLSSISSPAPVPTPALSNEKSTLREESGTGSLPSATETSSLPPSAGVRATTASGEPMTAALMQELAGLREQVRHLTEMQHRTIMGGSVYSDGNDPHEPPPEYVGRDSDEHSRA